MATIAEKQADGATLIDDLATVLTSETDGSGNQYWTDADAYVDNSGNDTSWYNNGRVFYNPDMGIYMLFYLTDKNGNGLVYDGNVRHHGVRFVYSSDWDSDGHHPAGNTNVTGEDPFSGDVGFSTKDSYPDYSIKDKERTNHTLAYHIDGEDRMGPADKRGYDVTYFLSANQGYLTAAVWNTTDTDNGAAGYHMNEWTEQKFWNDGYVPFHAESRTSRRALMISNYGFKNFQGERGSQNGMVGGTFAVQSSAWGIVNPDANDDTFFFRRPILFKDPSKDIPAAYVYDVVHNDPSEGAAHGDTITFDGVDYRCIRQSGNGTNELLTALLRYE